MTTDRVSLARRTFNLVALLLFAAAILTASAFGQVVGATLSGTVLDPTGAAVPDANVSIKNVETGVVRDVVTKSNGFYSAPNLQPGPYTVTVNATGGFTKLVRSGIVLTVGASEMLNLTLQLGQVAENIDVTGATPEIQTASSEIGSVVTGEITRELPLNGRDWTQLATLQPGIAEVRSQPDSSGLGNRGNRGFGKQMTISGGRPQQNNYRLDGVSVNDYANSSPGSTLGVSLGADAIQEFSVVSSNYSAAYGKTSGGVVNAMTRAGTNKFHGSVYEFLRNEKLDAKNKLDMEKPPFKRNQFGFSLGGPIHKDKTFIFGDYEGLQQVLTSTAITTVPSAAARAGNLVCATNPNAICPVVVSPAVKPYLDFWAQPNGGVNGNFGNYIFDSKSYTPEHFFTVRADHTFSAKDSAHVTYLFDNATTTAPDGLNVMMNMNRTRRQAIAIEETHVFSPALVNAFRFGANRVAATMLETLKGNNPLGMDQSLSALPNRYAPQINVPGLTTFGGGLNGTSTSNYGFTSYQFYDDAFFTKGIHSLKFGFAFERIQSNLLLVAAPDGTYRFNSLSDFLTNKPKSFQIQLGTASPRNLRQSIYGAYFEDDMRLLTNLTVNLGVRYEPASVPTEVAGKLANLRTLTSQEVYTDGPYFQNPTLKNFSPRVGFSWDPFKNGKTAIRGGFGIFDSLPLTYQFNLMSAYSAPFFEMASATTMAAGSFPTLGAAQVQADNRLRAAYVQYDMPRNYVMQWNFNIQRELLPNVTLMVGYVGNHGVHQPLRTTDANVVQPVKTAAGLTWPCAQWDSTGKLCTKTGGTVVNPKYGQIDGQEWSGSSVYDAMIVEVRKRMSHGFQLQGSFTWAKGIDTASSVVAGSAFTNSIAGQFLFAPLRSLSDFNIKRNLVVNGLWDIPTPKFASGIAKNVVGGWQLAGIFQVSDGLPFTPLVGGDPLFLGNTVPFQLPNRVNSPECRNPVNIGKVNQYIKLECFTFPSPSTVQGNAGRNSIIGPGLLNTDMSLFKKIPISKFSETANLQFRFELFNVFNRGNYSPPTANNKLFDAKGAPIQYAGQITATSTSARELQLGIKLSW